MIRHLHVTGRLVALILSIGAVLPGNVARAADYVVFASGVESGTMSVTGTQKDREIRYRFNDRGRGPDLHAVTATDDHLLPVRVSIDGLNYFKTRVTERYERTRPGVAGHGFYLPGEHTPEHLAMLTRALLIRREQRLAVSPRGETRIEQIAEHVFEGSGGPLTARLYLLDGLGFDPIPVWLDPQGELLLQGKGWFVTVRRDVQDLMSRMLKVQAQALETLDLDRTPSLVQRVAQPIAFRNVRLFDAAQKRMRAKMTVLVRGSRIAAIGHDLVIPRGAHVIDGRGKTLMPGLWDMHAHILSNREGLLYLAAGVTSVRDLGNTMDDTLVRQRRFADLRLAGPRMILAGVIDGPGPLAAPIRVYAATPDELRTAIRNYARSGYRHIKLYSSLDPALVPVAVDETRRLGMRLSGHVPARMTMREAVAAGFDEVHHLNFAALNFMSSEINAKTNGITRITAIAEHAWEIDPASDQVGTFLRFLRARNTVVDPTVNLYESSLTGRRGAPDPAVTAIFDRLPPLVQRMAEAKGLAQNQAEIERNARSFRTMLGLVKAMHDAGIPLVAGSDTPAGLTYQRELELYEVAGIPRLDILHIATLGAARVAGLDSELGSIAPGKRADLLLVEGDPARGMSALRRTSLVMRDGVMFDPERLRRAAGMNGAPPAPRPFTPRGTSRAGAP